MRKVIELNGNQCAWIRRIKNEGKEGFKVKF